MATFSEVQSSQDAKVGGCEKLKSEFYAKLFDNIRFQEAKPQPGAKRLFSDLKECQDRSALQSLAKPIYQVYEPAKRVRL